jgi:hypothetical protein
MGVKTLTGVQMLAHLSPIYAICDKLFSISRPQLPYSAYYIALYIKFLEFIRKPIHKSLDNI